MLKLLVLWVGYRNRKYLRMMHEGVSKQFLLWYITVCCLFPVSATCIVESIPLSMKNLPFLISPPLRFGTRMWKIVSHWASNGGSARASLSLALPSSRSADQDEDQPILTLSALLQWSEKKKSPLTQVVRASRMKNKARILGSHRNNNKTFLLVCVCECVFT